VTVRHRLAVARRRAAVLLVVLSALLAGCGGDESGGSDDAARTAPVVLRAATLQPGQPVPAPAGPTLVTLTGKVGAANMGENVALDRRTLDRLTQVELRTYEPWVKKDLSFRGVWLSDVLALAGADRGAEVQIVALDDYTVRFSRADLSAGGILLATSDGAGAPIPVDEGGPTRIVFAPGTGAGANADQWIWSLRTIDVR
jgi:hypothetical protein